MALNDRLFLPQEITCPICENSFTRYTLRKKQFSLDKRDIDYRPVYLGKIHPRAFAICVCPHCYYAAEDKFFCAIMSADDIRRKTLLDSHKAQWDAASRVKAASSGQQIWKDPETEKLRELSPASIAILRKISPLLQKVVANITQNDKPINELQKEGDPAVAVRSYELAAICYKVRKANHRILGYTYLSGAWAARDAQEVTEDEATKSRFYQFERAYLEEAVSFLTITNKATSVEDVYGPDGSRIPRENIPQSRVFEIMYILAGANKLLGDIQASNAYLEQIIYGSSGAQGIILWFVNQARDMRQEEADARDKKSDDGESKS